VYVEVRLLLKRFAQQYNYRLQATGASIFISVTVLAGYLVVQINMSKMYLSDDEEPLDNHHFRLLELLGFISYIGANLLVLGGLLLRMVLCGDKANSCWTTTKRSLRQWQLELRAGCLADYCQAHKSTDLLPSSSSSSSTTTTTTSTSSTSSTSSSSNPSTGNASALHKKRKAMCHMLDAAIAVLDYDDEKAPLKLFGVRASIAVVGGAIGSVLAVVTSALLKAVLQ
jgi:hypothetical protein